jgi:hypothetical protein
MTKEEYSKLKRGDIVTITYNDGGVTKKVRAIFEFPRHSNPDSQFYDYAYVVISKRQNETIHRKYLSVWQPTQEEIARVLNEVNAKQNEVEESVQENC